MPQWQRARVQLPEARLGTAGFEGPVSGGLSSAPVPIRELRMISSISLWRLANELGAVVEGEERALEPAPGCCG